MPELGSDTARSHYRLTLRPWASFLDINSESRMYCRAAAASGPSWQEIDFDFISRLFEWHGI